MSSRSEREKQKAHQEKFQAVLSNLLKDDDNKYCVDCDAKGPRWAAWNLGLFLCIRCAGIHRNLGVHISKVKSVNLDAWTAEQVAMMMEMGNSRGRAVYEANIPDNYRRPQTDSSSLENFIRAKYETKKYIAKEWIPPKPTIPKELLEDEKDKKKPRPKATGNLQITAASRSSSAPQFNTDIKTENKPAQTAAVKTEMSVSRPHQTSSSTADLIGLDAPSSPQKNANSLLSDFMGLEHSQPSQNISSQETNNQMPNGSIETNLFEDTSPSTSEGPKSTKDSILALYGGQQKQQQFNVPGNYSWLEQDPNYMQSYQQGGMYVPQNQSMAGMYQMPQQQQQQPMMMAQTNQVPVQVPVQQPQMYGNQMGMVQGNMGMQQGNMGMVQGNMGMQQGMVGAVPGNMGMQQGMRMPQNNMYGQQQMQQMQFQQMQNQMAGMSVGQQGQMTSGMTQNGIPVGQGWSGAQSGHTLSNNLWQ